MKKLAYFVEWEPSGGFAYIGDATELNTFLETNLEEDDEQKIKAKYMTQEEIDALPDDEV